MEKTAYLRKKKNENTDRMEWALVSKDDQSKILKWFGPKKPSKEEVKEEEKRVQYFKHKGGQLLNTIEVIADELDSRGFLHLADSLSACLTNIASKQSIIRISKIANLLDHKGEYDLAEQLDAVLPELLSADNIDGKVKNSKLSADKAFRMYRKLKTLYITGMVDEKSLEYNKMGELENMLKTNLVSAPKNKTLPKNINNWWNYFGGKR